MFPFFIWLNYRGWLRADSLEELVGLDVSYHGRSTHGENGDIKKEYIEAYNRYKGTIRQSRHGHNNSNPDRQQLPFSEPHSGELQSSSSTPINSNIPQFQRCPEEESTKSTTVNHVETDDLRESSFPAKGENR
jgi:hypothetical protein